jgi:hypothetical protein
LRKLVSNVFEAGLEAWRFVRGDGQNMRWEALAARHELSLDVDAMVVEALCGRIEARTSATRAAHVARLATASLADISHMPEEPAEIAFAAGISFVNPSVYTV